MSGGNDLQLSVIIRMIDETTSAAKSIKKSIEEIGTEATGAKDAVKVTAEEIGRDVAATTAAIKSSLIGTLGGFKDVTDLTRKHFDGVIEQTGQAQSIHAGAMSSMTETAKRAAEEASQQSKLAAFKAKEGLQEITKQAKDSGQELIENAEKVGAGIGKAMLLAGGAWAGGKAVGFLQDSINKAIELADKFDELQQQTGLAAEELAGLKFAAEQHGTSLDTVAFALGNLQRTMGAGGNAAEQLRNLGIDAKAPMEMLLQVAAAMEKTVDPTERAAIAQAAFGRGWRELMPMLKEGPEALGKLADAGVKYYKSAADMAEQAAKVKDSQAELQTAMDALQINIGVKFIPDMAEITSAAAMAAREEGLATAFTVMLGGVMKKTWDVVKLGWDALAWALQQAVETAFLWPIQKTQEFTDEAGKWVAEVGGVIAAKADEWKEAGAKLIDGWKEGIAANLRGEIGIGKKIADAIAYVKATVKDWVQVGKDIIQGLINGVQDKAKEVMDKIRGLGGAVVREMKDLLGIKSPSTVFAEMGKNVADGFTLGILQNTPKAVDATKKMAKAVKDAGLDKLMPDSGSLTGGRKSSSAVYFDDVFDANRKTELANLNVEFRQGARDIDAWANAVDASNQRLDSLIDRLEPANAKTQKFTEEMDRLTAAAHDGNISMERYVELSEKLATGESGWVTKGVAGITSASKTAASEVERMLSDALMRGFEGGKDAGKNFVDTIKNYLKTAFLKPIAVQISASLTGAVGMGGTASASGGGGSDSLSTLSSLNSAYKAISSGFSSLGASVGSFSAASAYGTTAMSQQSTMLAAQEAGMSTTTGALGGAASMLGGMAVGYVVGKMISGGYSALGKSGNTAVVAGTVIGAAIGGPIGAAIGGAIGGAVNRVFGRKLAGTGIEGSFGAGNFSGTNYEDYKGGLFRSDKTKRSTLDPQVDALLDNSFATLQTKTALMATVLGQSASAINTFTSSIKLDFKGLTDKEIEEKIGAVFDDMGNSMASLIPGLEAVTRFGESSSAALTRLYDSIFAVNGVIDTLNLQLFDVSLSGAAMASSLADAFGGMDKLQATTSAYYSAFYTEEERIAESTQQLTQAMSNLGYALPASKEGFRDVVAALNLTTAAGQQAFSALMGLAPMFAEVANSWEAAAKESAERAAEMEKEAADKAVAAAREAADNRRRILDEQLGLESQLLQLQGNTVELRRRELQAIDPANQALQEQIWALEEVNAAADTYTEALNNAQQAYDQAVSAAKSAQSAVDAILDQATDNYLSAVAAQVAAQERITQLDLDAKIEVAQEAQKAADNMRDLAKSLRAFIDESRSPDVIFGEVLRKALGGDSEAMQALPAAARGAIDLAKSAASSASEFRLAEARVFAQMRSVAAVADSLSVSTVAMPTKPTEKEEVALALTAATSKVAAELSIANRVGADTDKPIDSLVTRYNDALKERATADAALAVATETLTAIKDNTATTYANVASLKDKFSIDLEVSAKSEIEKTISVITGTFSLSPEQKKLALLTTGTIKRTIQAVADASWDPETKELAFGGTTNLARTLSAVVNKSSNWTDVTKKLAFGATTDLSRTLKFSASTVGISETLRAQAFGLTELLSRTVEWVAQNDTLSEVARAQAFGDAADLVRKVMMALDEPSNTAIQQAFSDLSAPITKLLKLSIQPEVEALASGLTVSAAVQNTINAIASNTASGVASYVADSGATINTSTSGLGATATWKEGDVITNAIIQGIKGGAVSVNWLRNWYNAEINKGGKDNFKEMLGTLKEYGVSMSWFDLAMGWGESKHTGRADWRPGIGTTEHHGLMRGVTAFAEGGAFTNKLVNGSTFFDLGVMGEAGPEAIMPLTRMSNGNLGVEAQMPDWSTYGREDNNNAALVAELRQLRGEVKALNQEVVLLRRDNNTANAAIATESKSSARVLRKWDTVGMPLEATV